MNTFTFDGSWNRIKGKLKQKYAQLTDDDLIFAEGKGQELLGRLQARLGLSEAAAVGLLHELKDSAKTLGETVREKLSEAAAQAGEVVEDAKAKLAEGAGEACDEVSKRAHSLAEKAQHYVARKPVKALLTALAVGFVAGMIVRR
jgi:uncharacterized protein YjbJ (UPF0337 family)